MQASSHPVISKPQTSFARPLKSWQGVEGGGGYQMDGVWRGSGAVIGPSRKARDGSQAWSEFPAQSYQDSRESSHNPKRQK